MEEGSVIRIPKQEIERSPLDRHHACGMVLVIPVLAERYLSSSTGNRNLRKSSIAKYIRDMIADEWRLNGEPLIFDVEGHLRNGHHRLTACIQSGVSFKTFVIWGVSLEAFKTMDTGQSRKPADFFSLEDETNVNALQATVRLVWSYDYGLFSQQKWGVTPSATESADVLEDNPGLRESIARCKQAKRVVSIPSLAFLHAIAHRADAVAADEFVNRLLEGAGLQKGNPILVLRERLLQEHRVRGARAQRHVLLAYMIKAFNAYLRHEHIKLLKWLVGEPFPTVMGAPPTRYTLTEQNTEEN